MKNRRPTRVTRLLRTVTALAALMLAAAPGAALAGQPALAATPPGPGVFGIGPSSATKLDGRPYYYYFAAPGSGLTDHVAVINIGITPLTLSVYPTDATNSPDGSFEFPVALVKPVDVGSWVHIELPHAGTTITVPGRTSMFLPITLKVPADATPGDHAGALIASLRGLVRNSHGQLVHLDQRVATRIFIRVSGPLHPRLAIEHLAAAYHGSWNPFATGSVTVTYTVHNTGNVKLAGDQLVQVSGLFGTTRATGLALVPLLLPGGTFVETVQVHGVFPQLWMSGTVTVTALGLTPDINPRSGPWSATTHFWAIPWALILLIVALVLATLAYQRYRRGNRSAPRPGGPTRPPARKSTPLEPAPTGVST